MPPAALLHSSLLVHGNPPTFPFSGLLSPVIGQKQTGPPISSHFYFFVLSPFVFRGKYRNGAKNKHPTSSYFFILLRSLFLYLEKKYRNGGKNNRGFSVHFHKPTVHPNSQHQSKQAPSILRLYLNAHVSILIHVG